MIERSMMIFVQFIYFRSNISEKQKNQFKGLTKKNLNNCNIAFASIKF